jgi:hypothetical protein
MKETIQQHEAIGVRVRYSFEARDKQGNLKWLDGFENLVVATGRNALLNNTFDAPAGAVTWFVGLKAAGVVAAGDTMASHAGWTEVAVYDEATRPAWTKNGASTTGAMSNSSARATFTINATVTVAGAFLTSNNTKSGTTGVLFGVGDFVAPRALEDDDSLLVQVDLTVTSS